LNTRFIRTRRLIKGILLITLAVAFLSCHRQPPITQIEPRPASSPTPLRGPAGFPPAVMNKPYPGTGVVASINKKEGWIEINHEEIKGLMPAMQMEFNVKDKSLLDKVKVGDRVDFTIVETEKGEYLTEINRKPASSP
jgi:Cu/Ag efflux protein CusF